MRRHSMRCASFARFTLIAHPIIELIVGNAWRDAAPFMPWNCLVSQIQALSDLQDSYLMALR